MWFWFSCLAAGVSLITGAAFVMRPVLMPGGRKPHEGARHGVLSRWCWPWVAALAPACRRLMSWQLRARMACRLQQAGAMEDWRAEHVVAAQLLAALAGGVAAAAPLLLAGAAPMPSMMLFVPALMLFLGFLPFRQLQVMARERRRLMLREFPFMLDIATLCVEAGSNLQGALAQASAHCPKGPLQQELVRTLAQVRTGVPRHQALNDMAARTGLEAIRNWAMAVRQSEQLGMSLAPLLRAQASRQRDERFLRAETLALQAPVKMLFPLVLCIFPCTFLIIAFPVVMLVLEDLS